MTLTNEELARLPTVVRNLFDTVEKQKKALEEIKEFGFKNSGKGYTCATMAEKALNEIKYP